MGSNFSSFVYLLEVLKSGFCLQVLTLDNLSRKESDLQGNMKKTDLEAAQSGKMPKITL